IALVVGVGVGTAYAGVTGVFDRVWYAPPVSPESGDWWEANTGFYYYAMSQGSIVEERFAGMIDVFDERQCVPVRVPGACGTWACATTITASCHLIHANLADITGTKEFPMLHGVSGRAEFDRPVLRVVADADGLAITDDDCGLDVGYPSAQPDREFDANDSITATGAFVDVTITDYDALDQARVITQCNPGGPTGGPGE
ncbi:MAG: hypothetical protein AAF211_33415, partial [Myxococcota bacterium]